MPVVEMPDGRVIQFPDTMSTEEINKALAGESAAGTAPPSSAALPTLARVPAGLAAAGARGGIEGRGIPGLVTGFVPDWLRASHWAAAGSPAEKAILESPTRHLPGPEQAGQLINALGIAPSGALEPQNLGERLAQRTVEGLGQATTMGGLGRLLGLPIGDWAQWLRLGGMGGAGAQMGKETGLPGAETLGGFIGGGGAQGVQSMLEALRYGPRAALSIASRLAPTASRDLEEVGRSAQARAWQWQNVEQPRRIGALWQRVDGPGGLIDPIATQVPLTDFESTLRQIAGKGGTVADIIQGLPAGTRAKRILEAWEVSPAGGLGLPTAWHDARALRSAIGDARSDAGIAGTAAEGHLNNLYRALTGDLDATAAAISPEAAEAFRSANTGTEELLSFRDKTLRKLVYDDQPHVKDPSAGAAVDKLLAGGKKSSEDLLALRQYMPEVADQLGAGFLRDSIARGKPGDWSKIRSEASRAALVPNAADRETLDEMAKRAAAGKGVTRDEIMKNPILASFVGGELGETVGHLMTGGATALGHLVDNPALGSYLRLAGLATPFAWSAARNLLTHPEALAMPLGGAIIGASGGR